MAGQDLPLPDDDFIERPRAAGAPTDDNVSITMDGRLLDSKEAVLAWLAEVEADRAAGRPVRFDKS